MSINILRVGAWRRRREGEEEEEGVRVGGQENELFAYSINLIMKKLKGINRRVIEHLSVSRWVCSLDFEKMVASGAV